MKRPSHIPLHWPQAALLGLWLVFLTGLLDSTRYQIFLRPEFRYTLIAGAVVLLGMLLALLHAREPKPLHYPDALRLLVLLLPLLFAIFAQPGGLGGMAYQKRSAGLPELAPAAPGERPVFGQTPLPSLPMAESADPAAAAEIPPQLHDPQALAVTIATLCAAPEQYQGKRVEFRCMALRDAGIRHTFGPKTTVLFRFLINCCAADAIPVSLLVRETDALAAIPDNGWVIASGVFQVRPSGDKRIPWLDEIRIHPSTAPPTPYLY